MLCFGRPPSLSCVSWLKKFSVDWYSRWNNGLSGRGDGLLFGLDCSSTVSRIVGLNVSSSGSSETTWPPASSFGYYSTASSYRCARYIACLCEHVWQHEQLAIWNRRIEKVQSMIWLAYDVFVVPTVVVTKIRGLGHLTKFNLTSILPLF